MIHLKNIKYQAALLMEDGSSLNISDIAEAVSWEENKGELATRITLTLKNHPYNGRPISSLAKIGCMVVISINLDGSNTEVARGTIMEWQPTATNSYDKLKLICYDALYNLQKSQDNLYYPAGTGTQTVIMDILNNWGIPAKEYAGSNVAHGKLVYKTEYLADVILDLLDETVKKGGERCFLRSSEGSISILREGSNIPVYHLGEAEVTSSYSSYGILDMVTRVKILGKEDKEGQSPVEAVMDGRTEFGVRQRIYVRSKDDSLAAAQTAAQEILDEKGSMNQTHRVEGPDLPYLRRGDRVHVTAGVLDGYYLVAGIRHDGDSGTMSLELKNIDTD